MILAGGIGATRLKNDLCMEQAYRNWMNARIFYNAAAYGSVEKEYRLLYPLLKKRAAFCLSMVISCINNRNRKSLSVF